MVPNRRRIVIEAIEPRYLLSADGLALPPPVKLRDDGQVLEHLLSEQWRGHQAQSPASNGPAIYPATTSTQIVNEIIFVDTNVDNKKRLIELALSHREQQEQPSKVEVVVLDSARDGIYQMTWWLSQYKSLSAVHILSHGDEARLQLGSTELSTQTIDSYANALRAWQSALSESADILIYGCDVASGTAGSAFVRQIAALTGADVAASVDATGHDSLGGNWMLETSTGLIDATALRASQYSGVLSLTETTLPLNSGLRTQVLSGLTQVDALANQVLANELLNANLPGLGSSVNELIGLDTALDDTESITLFNLYAAANAYFAAGDASTLTGLATALQTDLATKTAAIAAANSPSQLWTVAVTPTFDPAAPEVIAGLNIKISLTNWEKAGQTFGAIGALTWASDSLTTVANLNIDIDVALIVSGVTPTTNEAQAITNAASTATGTWLRFNHFSVGATVSNTSTSNPLSAEVKLSARVADPDNHDGKNRVSLTEISSITEVSDRVVLERTAQLSATNTSGKGLFGVLSGTGALAVAEINDVTLTGSLATELRGVFDSAGTLMAKIDTASTLGITLPMADVSMTGLLTLEDGRTLGDVLALRTLKNTSVLDDYLATTGITHTLSGLLSRIQQYLSGTGVYDGLVAVMPALAPTSVMNIRSTGYASNQLKLDLALNLNRKFVSRFVFNDKLTELGFNWLPGEGVNLVSDIVYDTTWIVNGAGSDTIQVNALSAQVQADGAVLDTGVALGALEGRAKGSVVFDAGVVTIGVGAGAAITTTGVADAVIAVSGTPTIKAAIDFDVIGKIGATSFGSLVNTVLTDNTASELVITTSPTINAVTTTDTTPTIIGTATLASGQSLKLKLINGATTTEFTVVTFDGSAYTVSAGATYDATTRAWTIDLATLALGNYTVTVELIASNNTTVVSSASAALSVVSALPAKTFNAALPTVHALTTNTLAPVIMGTTPFSSADGLTVAVNGINYTTANGVTFNPLTHEWSLALPTLAAGTYSVTVTAQAVPHVSMSFGSANT
ncbi:MAG: hypothetical protein RLZZ192_1704, partial [Pseudomonadota bacterium]